MPAITSNNYTKAEALLPELTEAYHNGESTNALAKRYGIRREAISTVLVVAGVIPSTPGRDRLLEYVREHNGLSVDDLSTQLSIPKSTISRYLRGTKEQQLVITRKKSDYTTYSNEVKIEALIEAWDMLDDSQRARGLSRVRYDKLVGHRPDRPSSTTFIRRWGSWAAACQEAGINAGVARRTSYEQEFSNEAIIQAISDFIDETGETSFHAYSRWAREHGFASGPLVVIRHGSWSNARQLVLELERE